MKHLVLTSLAALALGTVAANAQSAPASAQTVSPKRSCFPMYEMRGWKAADTRTIYIRVDPDRIFRLDLAQDCPLLRTPAAHLITDVRGSELVCTAVDWDLAVSEGPPGAMPERCIVKEMTLLTPDEAAALPATLRPR